MGLFPNPISKSYFGKASCVSVVSISDLKPAMETVIKVKCTEIAAQPKNPELWVTDVIQFMLIYKCGYKTDYIQAVQEFKRE
jgi:hypothetical protein